ncbi:carbohydrate esterase family 4 protein, partial [Phycomyces blakesleeanus NRRL 1555(-)]
MPVSSPTWLSSVPIPTNVATKFPTDQAIIPGPLAPSDFHINKKTYPAANKVPSVDHPEVQKVIGSIDWTKVSKSPIRKVVDWSLDLTGYDYLGDPDCWSSSSLCRYPKALDLPEDVHECPNSGDWGLSYDDGPFRAWTTSPEDKAWESPRLYNFLATTGNQKATLFYVGHNVINFPVAAQRALADGHTLCAHTWSHKQMTSLTNEEVVAELYWTMKAIKETTGVTTRCWRPPYGDVDDRVRSIAWQMGLRTIVWDRDSNDWDLNGVPGGGHLSKLEVGKIFEKWISRMANRQDRDTGHVSLEHENNREALAVAEEWLPRLQNQFNVVPIHECIGDPNPYWEANWKFPWPAGKFNGS